jgi:vanillate O-demethylase monooxygenase subunit
MLTAQQRAIDANPDYEFYSLNVDSGGMWVRRILDRMLVAENRLAAPPPTATPVQPATPVPAPGPASEPDVRPIPAATPAFAAKG